MTKGSPLKLLLLFGFPILLGNLFQQFYTFFDSIIVGSFVGDNALAAINATMAISNLFISVFSGLALGAQVMISQAFGAKNITKIKNILNVSTALSIVLGLVVVLATYLLAPLFVEITHCDPAFSSEATLYLRVTSFGLFFLVFYNLETSILRGIGDSIRPLFFLIVSSVVNIILDLVFIIVFKMGIEGAGLATVISQMLSAYLVYKVISSEKFICPLRFKEIRIILKELQGIFKIGIPTSIQNSLIQLSNILIQSSINGFGIYATAGAGVSNRIGGFINTTIFSIAMAITSFIAQNYGAQKNSRVNSGRRVAMKLILVIVISSSSLIYFIAPTIVNLFSNNAEVIYYGSLSLRVNSFGFIFLGITHVYSGVLRGLGKTEIPMYITMISWCLFRVLWVFIAIGLDHDIFLLFIARPISWLLSTIAIIIYYHRNINHLLRKNVSY